MSQSTTITIEIMHHEWTEYYGLVRWLCRRRLVRFFDGPNSHDIDERIAEAIAHAWKVYPRLRQRRPEYSAKTAICLATKTGVSRVRARTRFIPKPYRGYIDAMDRRGPNESYLGTDIPERLQQPVPIDPQDRTGVESLIDILPSHLRPVATSLSYGMTKRAVAESRNISETTLRARIRDIRSAFVS